MFPLRAVFALATLPLITGCGYVHFGRLPQAATAGGDAALAAAYSDLRTEHKMLQQELILARREGDSLRTALERGAGASDLATRLQDTTRELSELRTSYARLQAERSAPAATAMAKAQLEEKLAATLRDYTQLQEENTRLRADVSRTREENTTLAAQLKTAAAQNERAEAALAQLNTELLTQKEARARADQQAEAARAQLAAVVASATTGTAARPSLADARAASARDATTLSAAAAPPPEPARGLAAPLPEASSAVAELRTNPERIRNTAASAAPPASDGKPRVHTVRAGETLEMIAKKYYGTTDRWAKIYFANNAALSGGRPLKAGMQLVIPEN